MGRNNRKKKSAAPATAPEPPPPDFADKTAELEYFKSRGNEHFGKGAIQLAIECYTKALAADPNSAAVLLAPHRLSKEVVEKMQWRSRSVAPFGGGGVQRH
jgi:hypothetical protein